MSCARAAAAAIVLAAPSCARKAPAPESPTLAIPRAAGPIAADGRLDEVAWKDAFRSPAFADARGRAAPHTELRALAGDDALYLAVYVADRDLRSRGDAVRLRVGPLAFELSPGGGGALPAGVARGEDVDGTVDAPGDEDEEWVTELAIPWTLVGGRRDGFTLRALRIDASPGGPGVALAWPAAGLTRLVAAR